jgi:hypothetical protein
LTPLAHAISYVGSRKRRESTQRDVLMRIHYPSNLRPSAFMAASTSMPRMFVCTQDFFLTGGTRLE